MFSLRVCLSVCLYVCLYVSTITEKVARGSASDSEDTSRMSPCRVDFILVRIGAVFQILEPFLVFVFHREWNTGEEHISRYFRRCVLKSIQPPEVSRDVLAFPVENKTLRTC